MKNLFFAILWTITLILTVFTDSKHTKPVAILGCLTGILHYVQQM